jgi:hypothetical protein
MEGDDSIYWELGFLHDPLRQWIGLLLARPKSSQYDSLLRVLGDLQRRVLAFGGEVDELADDDNAEIEKPMEEGKGRAMDVDETHHDDDVEPEQSMDKGKGRAMDVDETHNDPPVRLICLLFFLRLTQ